MIMLYFSGTGNSKFIAHNFSKILDCDYYSIEEKKPFHDMIKDHSIIAFCYPIYGSLVPKIMRQFVSNHVPILKGKKIIVFCTQLLFSGDGARALTDLIPDKHCQYIYAEHFNMPNNICNFPLFPITSKEHNEKVKKKSFIKIKKACADIQAGRVKLKGFHMFSRILGMTQGLFWPKMEKKLAGAIQIDDSCTKCGRCIALCPVNNLKLENGSITTNNNCICCYRCLNLCPQKAIYGIFGRKVKRQYRD